MVTRMAFAPNKEFQNLFERRIEESMMLVPRSSGKSVFSDLAKSLDAVTNAESYATERFNDQPASPAGSKTKLSGVEPDAMSHIPKDYSNGKKDIAGQLEMRRLQSQGKLDEIRERWKTIASAKVEPPGAGPIWPTSGSFAIGKPPGAGTINAALSPRLTNALVDFEVGKLLSAHQRLRDRIHPEALHPTARGSLFDLLTECIDILEDAEGSIDPALQEMHSRMIVSVRTRAGVFGTTIECTLEDFVECLDEHAKERVRDVVAAAERQLERDQDASVPRTPPSPPDLETNPKASTW